MLRAPFPPIPIPKALYGTSFYVGYIVSERGSIERVSMIVADVPAYTRDLLNEVRRATFRPAQKEDGTPTRGYYQMSTAFPPRAP